MLPTCSLLWRYGDPAVCIEQLLRLGVSSPSIDSGGDGGWVFNISCFEIRLLVERSGKFQFAFQGNYIDDVAGHSVLLIEWLHKPEDLP